jgi:hypothetical protein
LLRHFERIKRLSFRDRGWCFAAAPQGANLVLKALALSPKIVDIELELGVLNNGQIPSLPGADVSALEVCLESAKLAERSI